MNSRTFKDVLYRMKDEMNFADALELFDRSAPICTDKAKFIFIIQYGREIT